MNPLFNDSKQTHKEAIFSNYGPYFAVKTKDWLYTELEAKNGIHERMLYDHRTDRQENVNVSELPKNKEVVEHLHQLMQEHLKTL